MNLLIVAATEFEIEPFLKKKNKTEVLITGVGIPATVFHLTGKLLEKKYEFVIQAGIAGKFNRQFDLAEVVSVKEDAFADLGIEENGSFYSLFEKEFIGANDFPYTDGWLVNNSSFLKKIDLSTAKGITVNKVGDNDLQNRMMKGKYAADIESMEGAAFHYVCMQQEVNFLQLRSISNEVGERNKSKWKLKAAIENLNTELLKIIKNI